MKVCHFVIRKEGTSTLNDWPLAWGFSFVVGHLSQRNFLAMEIKSVIIKAMVLSPEWALKKRGSLSTG
jgi:hypothetical protein